MSAYDVIYQDAFFFIAGISLGWWYWQWQEEILDWTKRRRKRSDTDTEADDKAERKEAHSLLTVAESVAGFPRPPSDK